MTLAQFNACIAAWNRAQSGKPDGSGAPSDEEFEAMKAAHAELERRKELGQRMDA
jgi:hypothetical protein